MGKRTYSKRIGGKHTGGKHTGGKRGAPFGNRNRLSHGRYTHANIARRREIRALITHARAVMTRAAMVARTRHAFLQSRARHLANPPPAAAALCAARANFSKTPPGPQHNLPHRQRGQPP